MNASNDVADRWLADANPPGELRLARVRRFQIGLKCLHARESIGLPYNFAIGSPYSGIAHTSAMIRPKERSFLDRALEALRDRYPKERPTQVRLAKIAGCSQPAVREWGLPDRAPDHARVLRIAKETGVCVEWLYTERGPKYPPGEPQGDPFLKEWTDLDPETRRQIQSYREFLRTQAPKRQ